MPPRAANLEPVAARADVASDRLDGLLHRAAVGHGRPFAVGVEDGQEGARGEGIDHFLGRAKLDHLRRPGPRRVAGAEAVEPLADADARPSTVLRAVRQGDEADLAARLRFVWHRRPRLCPLPDSRGRLRPIRRGRQLLDGRHHEVERQRLLRIAHAAAKPPEQAGAAQVARGEVGVIGRVNEHEVRLSLRGRAVDHRLRMLHAAGQRGAEPLAAIRRRSWPP